MVSSRKETFTGYLVQEGLRLTPERRSIMEQAFRMHYHFEADQLFFELHRKGIRISKATIYRTLALLVEAGLLREVNLGEKHVHYEHLHPNSSHDHLICLGCGKVIEFKSEEFESFQEALCRKHGFAPAFHHVSINGYCLECRSKGKSK